MDKTVTGTVLVEPLNGSQSIVKVAPAIFHSAKSPKLHSISDCSTCSKFVASELAALLSTSALRCQPLLSLCVPFPCFLLPYLLTSFCPSTLYGYVYTRLARISIPSRRVASPRRILRDARARSRGALSRRGSSIKGNSRNAR